jgi:uncharacterized integral membrane protein
VPVQGEERNRVDGKTILGVVLIVIVLVFIAQNSEDARIDFLWFNFTMALWLTLLIVFLLGMMSAFALRGFRKDKGEKKK